jgi:hypothetical protein
MIAVLHKIIAFNIKTTHLICKVQFDALSITCQRRRPTRLELCFSKLLVNDTSGWNKIIAVLRKRIFSFYFNLF